MMIPQFKSKFFRLTKAPFLPKMTEKKVNGSVMDTQTPFGLFARISVLGTNTGYYHQ